MFEVSGLEKAFGDNPVLKGVNLQVDTGEVVALLGANGAGKSTLIACLSGAEAADAGRIVVDGETFASFTPTGARAAGIAVIYQHLSLIPALNAVDNIFLGVELRRFGVIDRSRERAEAQSIMDRWAPNFPLMRPIGELSMGQRQLVEIAKAIHQRPKILVLDEPTAALGPAEVSALLEVVAGLARSGLSIIYVTHLLEEVSRAAARVAVLRGGEIVVDQRVNKTTRSELVEAISPGSSRSRIASRESTVGDAVMEVRGLSGPGLSELDLDLHTGEIVGVFGLLGSGRTELLETLAGVRRSYSGRRTLRGFPVPRASPTKAARRGLHLVPSDRGSEAIFGSLRCDENVLAPNIRRVSRWVRSRAKEGRAFEYVARRLDVRPFRPALPISSLSGGNQQKLMVARYLHTYVDPHVILLDEPTQGVDEGARHEIYRHLREFVRNGERAALFTTSDVEEAMLLADRCVVLHRGQVVATLDRSSMTPAVLLAAAHGSTEREKA